MRIPQGIPNWKETNRGKFARLAINKNRAVGTAGTPYSQMDLLWVLLCDGFNNSLSQSKNEAGGRAQT